MADKNAALTLPAFQKRNAAIYGLQDDRFYSTLDLLTQLQRFTMRGLKGIRKNDLKKLETNLAIAFSWFLAITNRLHMNIEDDLWNRFPGVCSYCANAPCVCKTTKPAGRKKIKTDPEHKPVTVSAWQSLFRSIYPPESRSLFEAGVHLAEETGEVSEAVHSYLGLHQNERFDEVRGEMADYLSCLFGVANSADIDLESDLYALYKDGCHVCLKTPCECTFAEITVFNS